MLGLWVLACCAAMVGLGPWTGAASVASARLSFLYYRRMSMGQFGGITGDLGGLLLQVCECARVLGVAVAQHLAVFL